MKKIIHTLKAPQAIGPYSQAVEVNGILYVSGQIGVDTETGEFVPGGIREQTLRILQNIEIILMSAGYTRNDVVKSTVYLKDMNDFSEMNEVYASFYKDKHPARAAMQVARLPKDALIEIDTIAVR
ncbi:MAG: RidA family protein [Bacteroidales bacterium]|nr:RidA family protein [Bacteroidales bacterium]